MSSNKLRAGMIDLGRGHPSTNLLATRELAAASAAVYTKLLASGTEFPENDRHPLQYGTDAGPLSVRKILSGWFTRRYELENGVEPDLLAITCGASSGLANTCLQFTDPQYTHRIFMITPAYFLAARIFEDAGYGNKMCAIDECTDGLDVEQLRSILEKDALNHVWSAKPAMSGKRFKYLFYAVPTFSNPTGIVWTIAKRKALLELARQYDILIITDEVYDFLDFTTADRPVLRIVDLDIASLETSSHSRGFGNTISNMSFSKYLGPGLRIGTIQCATKELANQFSSGGANHSGKSNCLPYLANLGLTQIRRNDGTAHKLVYS